MAKKAPQKANIITKNTIDKSEKEIRAELDDCNKEIVHLRQRLDFLSGQSKVLAGALNAVLKLRADNFNEPAAPSKA